MVVVAELLAPFGSAVALATETVFDTVPNAPTFTTRVNVCDAPAAIGAIAELKRAAIAKATMTAR